MLEEGPSDAALDTLNQFPAEAQAAFEDVLRSCGRPYRGEPEMTLYECRDGRLASE